MRYILHFRFTVSCIFYENNILDLQTLSVTKFCQRIVNKSYHCQGVAFLLAKIVRYRHSTIRLPNSSMARTTMYRSSIDMRSCLNLSWLSLTAASDEALEADPSSPSSKSPSDSETRVDRRQPTSMSTRGLWTDEEVMRPREFSNWRFKNLYKMEDKSGT